jgi:hypothetical protein
VPDLHGGAFGRRRRRGQQKRTRHEIARLFTRFSRKMHRGVAPQCGDVPMLPARHDGVQGDHGRVLTGDSRGGCAAHPAPSSTTPYGSVHVPGGHLRPRSTEPGAPWAVVPACGLCRRPMMRSARYEPCTAQHGTAVCFSWPHLPADPGLPGGEE